MKTGHAVVLLGLLLPLGCTRTIVVHDGPQPAPPREAPPPAAPPVRSTEPRWVPERPPATAANLGIPGGHLPRPGECRIWVPGVPPGRQRTARSRPCAGIGREAPAGSWIVYRPTRDRRLVHVRVVDQRRPGVVVVVRVFDFDSGRFIREESPEFEERDDRDDRDRRAPDPRPQPAPAQPAPVPPPADPRRTPDQRPPEQRPRPEEQRPAPPAPLQPPPGPARPSKPVADSQPAQPSPPPPRPDPGQGPFGEPRRVPTTGPTTSAAPLNIPPGHLPEPGECRIWIPGTPPGRQPHRASSDCETITRQAPAGSWVVYRPTADRKVVHVRVVDARRAGVLLTVRVFDVETLKFLREERP